MLGGVYGCLLLPNSFAFLQVFSFLKYSSSGTRVCSVGMRTLLHTETPTLFFGHSTSVFLLLPKGFGVYSQSRPQLVFLVLLFCLVL